MSVDSQHSSGTAESTPVVTSTDITKEADASTSSSSSVVLTPPHQLLSVDIVNSTIIRPSGPRPNYVVSYPNLVLFLSLCLVRLCFAKEL